MAKDNWRKFEWQKYCENLNAKEIEIDEKVETLENYAFQDCPRLKKVVIGKNVKTIQCSAFGRSETLEVIELHPENQYFLFEENNLIEKKNGRLVVCVGIPKICDGVVSADFSSVFLNKLDVETLYLGKSLKKIDRAARRFYFKNIELSAENTFLELRGGCVYEKGGDELILGCGNGVIAENTVKVRRAAFEYCDVKRMVIPSCVREIDRDAFYIANIEELVFEEGVKKIGDRAFQACRKLKSLALPSSLEKMGEEAFENCEKLEKIESFGGLRVLPDSAFTFCKALSSVTLPGCLKKIERCAFYGCTALLNAEISKGVLSLEESVFNGCVSLEKFVMADSVTTLGRDVFMGCENLSEVKLSEKLKEIPLRTFLNCKSLKEIHLPASVNKLCELAFCGCVSLEKINLDNILKSYRDTFEDCKKLPKEVTKPRKPPAKAIGLAENMYSYYTFEEIAENFEPGSKICLLSANRKEIEVILTNAFTFDKDEYLSIKYKDELFFVEIENDFDEEMYDLYAAAVFGRGHKLYASLNRAYEEGGAEIFSFENEEEN